MSIFDQLERMTSQIADQTFANIFTCEPVLRSPNGRPIADPDRQVWQDKGILDVAQVYPAVEIGKRDRRGNDLHTLANGYNYELSVDCASYPQANEVKQGDRIRICNDNRVFEVIQTSRDGMSRIVFKLIEVR